MPNYRTRARTEEDEFLQDYLSWLKAAGYDLNFHVIDSTKHAKVTSRGYPDVNSSHPERGLLIAELKSRKGYPSDDQWRWLTRICYQLPPPPDDTAKSRVHLWKPDDKPMALTQMGTPEQEPVPCDCPVCRFMVGRDPFPRRTRRAREPRPRCPICSRSTTQQRLDVFGDCGRCPKSDIERYEATIIADRIIP